MHMPIKVELTEGGKLNWMNLLDETKKKQTRRKRGNFACVDCGRSYTRKDSLKRHVTYECGKDPQFECPFCPQKCKRKAHQIRHIKRRHKDKIGLLEENNPDLFIIKSDPNF